jgi:hypothetical protein
VVSDGLSGFNGSAQAGMTHHPINTGSGNQPSEPAQAWVNTVLGNVKAAITGTCRALHRRHVRRYLACFEWRFNRRTILAETPPRLPRAALLQRPTPDRFFNPPEVAASSSRPLAG